jgi:myo-inositol-1-phosphate synthase
MVESRKKRVGVLLIGVKGAISTTLIAAQVAHQTLDIEFQIPSNADPDFQHLPLLTFSDLVIGGWDISSHLMSESVVHHQIVPEQYLAAILPKIDQAPVYPGIVIDAVPILSAQDQNVRIKQSFQSYRQMVELLEKDILDFKEKNDLDRIVIVDLSSTSQPIMPNALHLTLEAFEQAIDAPFDCTLDSAINASMLYAYAGIRQQCHLINFTPTTAFDIPALIDFAEKQKVLLCGKDGKTGQTLYKTAIAPIFAQRGLKVNGWYSTNILGNRDGEVLNHPNHRQSKIQTKSSVLAEILGYDDFDHQVHIHYYKPRGDAKEAWDNIDIEGWFSKKMQMKINWLGWDSILAAPLVLDLIRWVCFFETFGYQGLLPQVASYFKYPIGYQKHHFFDQVAFLKESVFKHMPPQS